MSAAHAPVPASAVHDMTVAEVRKALGKMRQLWAQSSPSAPLFICLNLVREKTVAEFCTEFVYGHHLKRHRKSTQQRLLTPAGGGGAFLSAHLHESTGVAGPKGDSADPYPFTPGWRPRELSVDAADKWWDRGAHVPPKPDASPVNRNKKRRRTSSPSARES
jgi:hypothetical protein